MDALIKKHDKETKELESKLNLSQECKDKLKILSDKLDSTYKTKLDSEIQKVT